MFLCQALQRRSFLLLLIIVPRTYERTVKSDKCEVFYSRYTTGVCCTSWNLMNTDYITPWQRRCHSFTITPCFVSSVHWCVAALWFGTKRKTHSSAPCWTYVFLLASHTDRVTERHMPELVSASVWVCLSLPLYLCATQAAHRINHHLCSSSFHMPARFYPVSHQLPLPGCFTCFERSNTQTHTHKQKVHSCTHWFVHRYTQTCHGDDKIVCEGNRELFGCHNHHI